ncbi:MAG: glycosyltransferase family 2 protein [Candidatus Omnitrophica bacterium]|nr:glycosyltransferase family 2 protein [Candidatus Omnitrophota bacterium]
MQKKILAIIPAFNESGNIERTVQDVLALGLGIQPLVIDDGSKDNTADLAHRAGAEVVSLPFNLGIGGAVQTGYRYAEENDFDIAVQIDGDGQHDVACLAKLIAPVVDGEADLSVGSRFLEPQGGFRSSTMRRIGINFFVRLIRLLTKLHCTDPTSGFRACNRRLIRLFSAHYPVDFPEPEAIVMARCLSARIVEIPVVMHPRKAGISSIGKLKSPYYMIKVTCAIMLQMLKDRKGYRLWE